jgi:acetolactate decarboxylase
MKARLIIGLLVAGLQGPFYGLCAQQKEIIVHTAGEMRQVMHQNDLSAHASLDTILKKPYIIALGPLEGLQGEITVINSKNYITKAKGVSAQTYQDTTAKAAFLVYSQVPEWEEFVIPSFVKDIPSLENFITQKAKEQRYNFNGPIPFRISGKVASALIHVVNKTDDAPHTREDHDKIKVYFEPANAEVEMAGFYSTKHKGVFTHHDSFVHIHLVTADEMLSGHVDNIKFLPAKAKLLLPKWPESQRKREFKFTNSGSKKPFKQPKH